MTGGSRSTYRECSSKRADRLGSLWKQTTQAVFVSYYNTKGDESWKEFHWKMN
mgnify:FL=1